VSVIDWFAKKQEDGKGHRKIKRDIPGDLWIKCPACHEILYSKDLEKNFKICVHCHYHFRLTAQERIAITADAGSFQEINANLKAINFLKFVDMEDYDQRIARANKSSKSKDAVVTGLAKIGGFPVALGVMDFGYLGGSMGSVVGEKITRLIEKAVEQKLPCVIFSASGGARMQESIMSLMQMAKTSGAVGLLSEKRLPLIMVLTDPTTGGTTASFAMIGDIHLAEPNALIGFAGPRVIEQTIRQKLPKGFQRSEFLVEHGMVDKVVDRKEMALVLAQFIEFYSLAMEKQKA
jgi:acetyl-CoA carboxylase carboxyl transferase subunit beta